MKQDKKGPRTAGHSKKPTNDAGKKEKTLPVAEISGLKNMQLPFGTFSISPEAERRLAAFLAYPQIPSALEDLILEYITKKIQKPWNDPDVLNKIRNAIIFQKGRYWDERPGKGIPYGKAYQTFGYLAYQMPTYFVQTEHLLLDLAHQGLLKPKMKILDVGSGPGVIILAIIDFTGETQIRVRRYPLKQ